MRNSELVSDSESEPESEPDSEPDSESAVSASESESESDTDAVRAQPLPMTPEENKEHVKYIGRRFIALVKQNKMEREVDQKRQKLWDKWNALHAQTKVIKDKAKTRALPKSGLHHNLTTFIRRLTESNATADKRAKDLAKLEAHEKNWLKRIHNKKDRLAAKSSTIQYDYNNMIL
jgi:uncharacterized coiled-coil DUF342 family protein